MAINWVDLGTVTPSSSDWTTLPQPSIDDRVFRITCSSTDWENVRWWVWFRSRWPNGFVSQARRIYPKPEIQIIEAPIPKVLERDGWVLREIQLKRHWRPLRYVSYRNDGPLSLKVEGGHLGDPGQPTLSDPELQILLNEILESQQKIEEYLGGDPL